MVVLTTFCLYAAKESAKHRPLRDVKRFMDRLRLNIHAGRGGSGFPRYGGIGGSGGSVYLKASDKIELRDVVKEYPDKRVNAGHGHNSKATQILGSAGTDITVKVPIGVSVYNGQNHLIGDLIKPDDKILVVRGGQGGNPSNQYHGQKGEADNITLSLKLIADVGFVGFPNAGKSTLLRALSRAAPKVANYPFTTISPNIGIMEYADHRQISLADLPGLIEGAHRNFGLGHKFLKHVERTSMLLFIVDINGFRLNTSSLHRSAYETVMSLNKELEMYKEDLLTKPAILAVNKMDTEGAMEKYEELLEQLEKQDTSSLHEDIRPSTLMHFDEIIPIIARDAKNTLQVKQKIRTFIDIYIEQHRKAEDVSFGRKTEGQVLI
ncbi:GTP-binding protein 10 [Dermacentor variabilis]|uniref:GTP-binding protein 10 n=1 Tax=Dermacentor variabilis TaxID=34621 RepID=UPI003F5B4519